MSIWENNNNNEIISSVTGAQQFKTVNLLQSFSGLPETDSERGLAVMVLVGGRGVAEMERCQISNKLVL